MLALLLTAGLASAQYSGSLTVDQGSAASATNFQSFNDLADSLETYGVSGAVTVDVVSLSGPYDESVMFNVILGTSTTNTITINGNGETIDSRGATYTIGLNGTDYMTIDNMVIVNDTTASYARNVWIGNDADGNTISNCDIFMTAYVGTSSTTAYVAFSSGATSTGSGNHGTGNTINGNSFSNDGNTGAGPVFGLAYYGSGSFNDDVMITNNDITGFYNVAGYFTYVDGIQFNGNDIHTQRGDINRIWGAYTRYIGNGGIQSQFNGNTVTGLIGDNEFAAFFFNYCAGTSSSRLEVKNNVIDGNAGERSGTTYTRWGIIFAQFYNDYMDISNNDLTNNTQSGYYYWAGIEMYYYNDNNLISGNLIDNNENESGFFIYGIDNYFYGRSNEFSNNEISNLASTGYVYGIYNYYYGENAIISENYIHDNSGPYYSYGIYNYYRCANSIIDKNTISNNSADQYYSYAIYAFYYCDNLEITNNLITNNVGPYGSFGIYAGYYTDNLLIAHNTIYVNDDIRFYNYGLYPYAWQSDASTYQIKNNIVSLQGNSTQYSNGNRFVYMPYGVGEMEFEANVWYTDAGQYWHTSTTFAAWLAQSDEVNSWFTNPLFVDAAGGDFTPGNPEFSNQGVSGLATVDINNSSRTACGPDPGALEFFVDHDVANLVFTGTNECGNYTEEITLDFNNGTAVDIANVNLFYTINGSGEVVETIDTAFASATETFTFAAIPTFNTPGNNLIEAGIKCDDDNSNNILSHNIFITPSPSGADMAMGTTFDGYFNTGNMMDPDITVPNTTSIYDIVPPSKYTAGQYGTDWTVTDNSMTSGGAATTGLGIVVDGTAGTVTVDPDSSLYDSLVYVSFAVNDLNTGCDSIVGRWMYVPFTPDVDFDISNVCLGTVATFKNQSQMMGNDFMIYKWRYNDPNSDEDTSEIKDGFWDYSTYGMFGVELEVRNQSYPKFIYTVTKQITVTPTPETDFSVVNACEGDMIQFNDGTTSPVSGAITYAWKFGDGNTSTAQNPTHMYATALPEGYNVTLKATQNGCDASVTKKAYQFARPVASFSTLGACNLEDIQFNNGTTLAIGKAGYTWDFGDNGVSTLKDPTHVYSTSGSQTVTLTAYSEFGCEDEYTANITLLESPEADFTYDATCNLTPVGFTRTGSVPAGIASDFMWDFNGESTSTQENPSYLFSDIGTKEVTLTINSVNGCSSTITQELDVVLQATADFEVSDICEGDEAVFTNKSSVAAGDLTYTWNFGAPDVNGSSSSSDEQPRHRYASTGSTQIVNVTLTAEVAGGCDAEITKAITINAAPDASFTSDVQGRTVVLDAPSGYTIYQWRFGNGGSSTMEDPVYTYDNVDEGNFEVCLSVKNDECWSESCETVAVNLVGVEELTQDNTMINVYPNPSTGVFNLKVENATDDITIAVSDVLGNQLDVNIADQLNGNFIVDLSNVADGVYFVQVKNGDFYATKRITVSK